MPETGMSSISHERYNTNLHNNIVICLANEVWTWRGVWGIIYNN
jgi:hypothetical protein